MLCIFHSNMSLIFLKKKLFKKITNVVLDFQTKENIYVWGLTLMYILGSLYPVVWKVHTHLKYQLGVSKLAQYHHNLTFHFYNP